MAAELSRDVAAVKPGWPTERRGKRKWIRFDLEFEGSDEVGDGEFM
jgi:hypothetical protein